MTKDLKMSIVRDLMRVHYNGTDHKKKNVVISITQYFFLFKKNVVLTFLFIFETETEHEWGRGKREGDTESEAGSRL